MSKHRPIGPIRRQPDDPSVLRHRALPCPACGYQSDALGDPTAPAGTTLNEPADGDYTICFNCGQVFVFSVTAFGTALREPTLAELAEFSRSKHNTRIVRRLHQFHAEHPR